MWSIKAQFESLEYTKGHYLITFSTDSIEGKPQKFGNDFYTVEVKRYHPPKTNNANSYYWKLCSLLSDVLSKEGTYMSVARIHNMNLRTMWQEIMMFRDGSPVFEIIPNSDKAEQEALEDQDHHIMPAPAALLPNPIFTNSKGKEFRYYIALRGVRTMNSKEMSRLINIVIQNCQDQDIETLTPAELERLEGYEKQANH